jgi:chemotaxis protein histidine kinase CheA
LYGLYRKALSAYRQKTQLRFVRSGGYDEAEEEGLAEGQHPGRRGLLGLYHRALEYRQKTHLRLVRQEELDEDQAESAEGEETEGISAEERLKIVARIDRIVARSRIEVSPETLAYTPKRNGAVLPLLSNLAIFAVVIAAIFLTSRLLDRQEQSLASGKETVLTAESQVIAALKQESEQQLQQKDNAIADIQQKLQSVSKEREQLRSQADTAVQARAKELQADYDRRLAEEKARLEKQGVSQADIQSQLAQFEQAERKKYDDNLAAARLQAEADLAAKDRQITSLSAQYDRELSAARQDKQKLQDQLNQKQAELQSQFQQRQQQLESDRAKVTDELVRLQKERAQEQLVLDQILSGYERVNRSIAAVNYPQALKDLDSLRAYFNQTAVAALPAVQRRRDVEMFLIGSLDELIRNRQSQASVDTAALLEASAQLKAVSDLVARGDALSQAGDMAGAKDAYLSALGRIPSVSRGYGKVEEMRKAAEDLQNRQVADSLAQGNIFFQAGNFLGSLQRYRQSLSLLLRDDRLSRQLTDNVMNAGYRILAADELDQLHQLQTESKKQQELVSRIRSLRDQYKAYTSLVPASSSSDLPSPQSIATLLQAKILVRLLLDSEPLRSRYPGLSATMEKYFTALAAQGRAEGRDAVLKDVRSLLDSLASKGSPSVADLSRYATADQGDPILALLDRLEKMVQ